MNVKTPPYPEYYLNMSYYPVCNLLLLLFVTGFVILRSYTDVLRSILSTIFICHPNIFSPQVWMFKSFEKDANFLKNIWRWCSNRWHLEMFFDYYFLIYNKVLLFIRVLFDITVLYLCSYLIMFLFSLLYIYLGLYSLIVFDFHVPWK